MPYPLFVFERTFILGYHASYSCKNTIALAVVEKFRIKGFIHVETLIANNKISRKKTYFKYLK
jgi:hypothetical protein